MTRLTPEQWRQIVVVFATYPRALRPKHQRWLDECEWADVCAQAISLCQRSRIDPPTDDALKAFWDNRLAAAYRTWMRRRNITDAIVREISAAPSEPSLILEAEETRQRIAKELKGRKLTAKREARLGAMFERDLVRDTAGRDYEPAQRAATTEPDDKAPSGIDRQITNTGRATYGKAERAPSWEDFYYSGWLPKSKPRIPEIFDAKVREAVINTQKRKIEIAERNAEPEPYRIEVRSRTTQPKVA